MRFETGQSMRLGQQMKLAPRMIQSMEILQMPLAELQERIEAELSSNPTLEMADAEPGEFEAGFDGPGEGASNGADGRPDGGFEVGADGARDDFARLDEFESANPEAAANAFDDGAETWADQRAAAREERSWEPGSGSRARLDGEPDAKSEAMAQAPARGASLQEQLFAQWSMAETDARLRALGDVLIGFIEDDGYVRTPLAEVAEKAARPPSVAASEWPPSEAELSMALSALQLFLEPAGLAARDARECLLLQIDAQLDALADAVLGGTDEEAAAAVAPAEVLRWARALVENHLEDLAKNRLPRIAERSGLGLNEIKRGLEALRRLSLAPGRALVSERAEPIHPDAIVEYDDANDRYVAYLSDTRMSGLRINREYALMARDRGVPKPDRDFLKKSLSNAQWLMDAVEQRRGTLMRVVGVVLEEQRAALDEGLEALRPLPMTQVAERLGIHVATVSRAVADKHLLTPRGVVPLRAFFTGAMQTESGEEVSSNEIKAAVREIVDGEDKARPLSDEAIAKALQARGYDIARRTVAKYRGQMEIGPARLRKEF